MTNPKVLLLLLLLAPLSEAKQEHHHEHAHLWLWILLGMLLLVGGGVFLYERFLKDEDEEENIRIPIIATGVPLGSWNP